MEKITPKDIDWLLNLDRKSPFSKPEKKLSSGKKILLQVLFAIFLTLSFIVLPFIVLIKTSVIMNLNFGWNGWLSLAAGAGATILLLLIYVMILFQKIRSPKSLFRFAMAGTSALVIGFCVYGSFYLSGVHAKNDEIRNVYRSLHPILRVAVTTSTLADDELVITDIERVPEDYLQMGLAINERSLHYVQPSGYVHAIDLRTNGRWETRNFILEQSLSLMGFRTLRHTGTADHLHIALPL